MDQDAATQDVCRKIDREKAIINAANHIRQATANASINARVESQIRDARRNIEYFEQTLQDLRSPNMGGDVGNLSISENEGPPSSPSHGRPSAFRSDGENEEGNGRDANDDNLPAKAPYTGPGPGDTPLWESPNYSKLDLIKYDTAHLGPRIQFMLSQLAFKLSLEKQYQYGTEKLVKLYQTGGDRKSRSQAEFRHMESNQKTQLLTRALRRYEDLHVHVENSGDVALEHGIDRLGRRKPLTGHLFIKIHAVADVEHALSERSTFVTVKVDNTVKSRTKATKTGRWTDEQHEFDVDKANEIEVTAYDKSSGDHAIPIGFLWITLSDLADEIRRKRMEIEFNYAGWTTPDRLPGPQPRPDFQSQQPFNPLGGAGGATGPAAGSTPGSGQAPRTGPVYIDAWFSLEPVGRIQLTLNFTKQQVGDDRRPFDVGLNRKGAVRKKEDVVEYIGHKFTPQTFYNIMRCALCGDLLKYTPSMQCADCRYTCHQKCYQKVVTKCMNKSNAETDPDEQTLSHRIPHRFDSFSNIGANWCCHCGYMLPIGKRQARKCTECKLTCHANCMHFVPDLCGISMDRVNEILVELKRTRTSRMLQNNHQHASGPPTQRFVSTPHHQDTVSQNDSGRPHNGFSSSKERGSDPYQQPLPTSSFGQSSLQYQQRPPYNETRPVRELISADGTADTKNRIDLSHFDFLAVLGKGNFGKVMLAETKTTKQLYAIKVLKKHFIIENNEVEAAHSEKSIFLLANKDRHPFLYYLSACFQTETRIYFVMEYVSGGDLMLHIQRSPFSTARARFYAAEICLALKYFHDNGVVFRDLKLDNVLLAADGHIKLADYGLCKENMWPGSTTRTFCGTQEFMAPEILLDKDYGTAVDWWAFGVLIYQMLLQQSPFRGEDEDEIYDAILGDEPLYPVDMAGESVAILQRLLTRQPELRLGSGPTGAEEVMGHAFFSDVDWENVYHKRVPVPFVPTVKGRMDFSNFDPEFTNMRPGLTPVESVLSQTMQEEFRGFSYSADFLV